MQDLKNITLGNLLDDTAKLYPKNNALVFPDINYKITYDKFKEETDIVAKALIDLGIHKGEHIGIYAVNCPEWVILQFASAKVGCVLVNINPALKIHELEYILEQGDVTVLFLTVRFKSQNMFDTLKGITKPLPALKEVITIRAEHKNEYITWDQFRELSKNISDDEYSKRKNLILPSDVVNIQYTSGTTGFPKGAQLTHYGIVNNAYFCGINMNLTEKDSICIPVPLYHCFGCVLGTLTCVNFGIPMVFPSELFDPQKTLEAIDKEKCTALYGVPTMFIAELVHEEFNKYNLSSLRTGVIAGAPCPMELMKQLIEKMNLNEITIGYGFTEASPLITQTRFNDPLDVKVGTVGIAHQNIKVKIIDPSTQAEVPVGGTGELCALGYSAMKGYYKMPEKTKDTIDKDGWMHTGDLAISDKNGVYRIVGRIKDMIIRGGENIYPAEIEDFLMSHEKIEQVQVVGVPDKKYGEQVGAAIKLKEGFSCLDDEIKFWCKGQIADYKIPFYIKFVTDFPMTANGKIQKFKLRDIFMNEN